MNTFIYLYKNLLLLETINKCLYKSRTMNYSNLDFVPIGASEIIHHTPRRLVQNTMRVVSCRLEDMSCPFSFLAFPSLSFATLVSTYEKMFHFLMIEMSKMGTNRRADRQYIWISVQLRPLFVYTSTIRCIHGFQGRGVVLFIFQRGGLKHDFARKGGGSFIGSTPLLFFTRPPTASRKNSIFRRARDGLF
jgi:hypothetical protein